MKTPDQINIPEIVDENPLDILQKVRLNALLTQVETEVRGYVGLDPSVPADDKHIGTIAARISSFKATIEKMGKDQVDPLNKLIKETNGLRKTARDRMDALRAEWLAPRVAYKEEVAAHQRAVAEAFDLWAFGPSNVGEFGTPTLADFDALLKKMIAPEMTESFFGDRLAEATTARNAGLLTLEMRRSQWIEEEAIREAGRKALQVQRDAEAAQRHAEREAAEAKAEQPAEKPAEKAALQQPDRDAVAKAETHNRILRDLKAASVCDEATGKALIRAIYSGKITDLQIVY